MGGQDSNSVNGPQFLMENAMEIVEGDAVMETDATTAVEAGAVRPPDGIDALPYADKDFDVPGSRDAVRECPSSHTHMN